MSAGKSINDILAGAKAELGKADALSKSTGSGQHEYSHTPYALVKKPSPSVDNLPNELKAKKDMVDKANKALEQ